MPRIRLTVAYVGTRYQGWQVQGQGLTIQGMLEDKLTRICGEHVRVHGSGRTDSGVHALAQVAHFDVPESKAHIPWQKALNAMLPDDIAILDARKPSPVSTPAFRSAPSATPTRCGPNRATPCQRAPFVWSVRGLDFEAMTGPRQCWQALMTSPPFQNAGTEIKGTVRTLEPVLRAPGQHPVEWVFRFQADGFLKQMVRNLMGLLVEVGHGGLRVDEVRAILEGLDRRKAPATAPAQGLALEEVFYQEGTLNAS
jgi:pseudouridylate synthase I